MINGIFITLAVGAAGLYFMLASPGRQIRIAGEIIAVAATAALGVYFARWIGSGFEGRVFAVIFAVIAIAAALRVITHPRPVYSALYLVLVVLAVTALCILAAAEFLGVALIIVYAGAILVTYIFVIMLAQQAGEAGYDRRAFRPLGAVTMGFALAAAATQAMTMQAPLVPQEQTVSASVGLAPAEYQAVTRIDYESMNGKQGNVRAVGATLLTTYVVALEVAGLLLLVAMVGAIAIAQKRIPPEDLTPEERQQLQRKVDIRQAGREAVPF